MNELTNKLPKISKGDSVINQITGTQATVTAVELSSNVGYLLDRPRETDRYYAVKKDRLGNTESTWWGLWPDVIVRKSEVIDC